MGIARIALLVVALPACDWAFGLRGPHQSADAPPDLGTDYTSAVLADGPIAYWRFSADATTVVPDESADGANPGTYHGNAGPTATGPAIGMDNTAAALDGTGDYVDVGNRLGFEGTLPFSIEAWVNPSAATSYAGVVSKGQDVSSADHRGYQLFDNTGSVPAFGFERADGVSKQDVRISAALVRNRWTYIVVTFDRTDLRLYLDGTLVATKGGPLVIPATSRAFAIGARDGGASAFFPGALDEIAVYDRPLDQAAIDRHRLAAFGQ